MTPNPVAPRHLYRTQLLLTGFSTTALMHSLIRSTKECLALQTFGCNLSDSTVAALMFMVWHGFVIHQMWRIRSWKQNQSTQSYMWEQPPLKQATMWLLVVALITMLAHIEFLEYVDKTVTTINRAVLPNGSNVADAVLPKTNPHIYNKLYSEVVDFHE